MVKIEIKGLKLFGHHGVSPEEREAGQLFEADLQIEGGLGTRDELNSTVDYVKVIECAQQLNQDNRFQLLESFVQALAEEMVKKFPRATRVSVSIKKLRPALPPGVQIEWFRAEVVRERSS